MVRMMFTHSTLHHHCLKHKVILASKWFGHGPPSFIIPLDSVTNPATRGHNSTPWAFMLATPEMLAASPLGHYHNLVENHNLMFQITLSRTPHSQEASQSPQPEWPRPFRDLKSWSNSPWPEREKEAWPPPTQSANSFPAQNNHFPKWVTVWTWIPFRGKPHLHLPGCHITLWP